MTIQSNHENDDHENEKEKKNILHHHQHQQQQDNDNDKEKKNVNDDNDPHSSSHPLAATTGTTSTTTSTTTGTTIRSSNTMASKRLVEYFIVFSCEPQRRKWSLKNQPKEKKTETTLLKKEQQGENPEDVNLGHYDKGNLFVEKNKYSSVRIPVMRSESDPQEMQQQRQEIQQQPQQQQQQQEDADDKDHDNDKDRDSGMTMTPSRIRAMDSFENGEEQGNEEDEEKKEEEEEEEEDDEDEEESNETPQQPQPLLDETDKQLSLECHELSINEDEDEEEDEEEEKQKEEEEGKGSQASSFPPKAPIKTGNIHLPVFTDNAHHDTATPTTVDANTIQNDDDDDPLASNFVLKPVKTAQYPLKEHPDCPLNPMVSHFCFPQVLNLTMEYQMPRVHFFVLTNEKGKKLYGTALTVWEEYCGGGDDDDHDGTNNNVQEEISRTVQKMYFSKESIVDSCDGGTECGGSHDIEVSLTEDETGSRPVYVPKVLCILSSWPYLQSFREYLAQLYRLATMTNLMEAPIERYVQNICEEAPAPPPGMFELQIKVLSSTIKFWSPPGDQPIAYAALPFHVLFECLDLDNIIFVWYALTLERKVLLVSSQFSLLTICSEILCSLLFPMKWSHLYIPILPRFLSPMLDAPMPYLCGITLQNFTQSISDISDETIVVDLDQNLVTMGEKTLPFPPLPMKRRSKLEKSLQKSVGVVFWHARGLTRSDVLNRNGGITSKDMETAERVWREKLRGYDDAFSLAYTPDSETLLYGDSRQSSMDDDNDSKLEQSTWDSVQETFLRFYVSMLRDYSKFMLIRQGLKSFKTEEFVSSQRADYRYFLREFCSTQQFDCFVTKRMYEPKSPDVIFFDQSITAKKNRSKMTLKKKDTAFLISAKARRKLRPIELVQPSCETEVFSNLLDQIYAATSPKKNYVYQVWPRTFDETLFSSPRPIPTAIAAEFSRMDNITSSVKVGHEEKEDKDFSPGVCHSSIEVATFTLFFSLYCKTVGSDFEILRNKLNPFLSPNRNTLPSIIVSPIETDKLQCPGSDCGTNICSPCSGSVSKNIITSETIAIMKPFKDQTLDSYDTHSIGIGADANFENELETAQLVAMRQLDLAFSVLDEMCLRSLPTDQFAFKILMEACGRCGSTRRATQLITMMKDQYSPVDSEIYSNYLSAFSVANELNPDELFQSPFTNVSISPFDRKSANINNKTKWFSRDKTNRTAGSSQQGHSFETNETSSNSARSDSSHGDNKKGSRPGSSRKPPQRKPNALLTNEIVERYIMIGECLLKEDVQGGIEIDCGGDNCPQCTLYLTVDQIMEGWTPCSFTEYKTRCKHCKYKFLPRFIVKSKSPDFKGTQGAGTPLYCEFFSPWVLRREISLATSGGENINTILDPQKRDEIDFNNKLWWNLIVHLRMQNIPITFLLQGYFSGGIIL